MMTAFYLPQVPFAFSNMIDYKVRKQLFVNGKKAGVVPLFSTKSLCKGPFRPPKNGLYFFYAVRLIFVVV